MRRLSSVLLALALLPLAFTTTARAQDPADPTVYMVSYIDVAQASRAADVEQLRQLAVASRKDPGVVRFEVFQRTAPPNQFVIVGIWKDQQSYDAHAASAHVKTFRQKLEPHLVAPVDERPYVGLAVGPKDGAAIPAGSFVSVSHVDVIPPKKDDGIAALKTLPTRPARTKATSASTSISRRPGRTISPWSRCGAISRPPTTTRTQPIPKSSARCWEPRPARCTTSAGTSRCRFRAAPIAVGRPVSPARRNGRGATAPRSRSTLGRRI